MLLLAVSRFKSEESTYMTSELLVGILGSRSSVKVENNVEAVMCAPSDQTVKVLETSSWEIFVFLDEVLFHPVAKRDTNSVQLSPDYLLDIVFGNPSIPMFLESCIGFLLSEALDTSPLIVPWVASHAGPFIFGRPSLDDELGSKIDATDFIDILQPTSF